MVGSSTTPRHPATAHRDIRKLGRDSSNSRAGADLMCYWMFPAGEREGLKNLSPAGADSFGEDPFPDRCCSGADSSPQIPISPVAPVSQACDTRKVIGKSYSCSRG